MKNFAIVFLSLFLFAGILVAQDLDIEETLKSARSLVNKNDPLALKKFESVLAVDANHYEALWRSSFLHCRVGNRLSSKEEQAVYFRKAKDLAQKAIDVNGQGAEGYYAMGISLGRVSLVSSTKEKVSNARAIKANAEKALRYNNQHAGAWHLLGRLHVGVANASKAERIAAKTFFGGLPKDCSNERAIYAYQQALKNEPNTIMYMSDLAEAYYFEEQFEECEKTLNALLDMPIKTPDDPGFQEAAREMLEQF